MASGGSVPPEMTFESGIEVEEWTFIWKIKRITDAIQDRKLIYLPTTDFSAGPSQYTVQLAPPIRQPKRGIAFFLMLKEAPARIPGQLKVKCIFTLKDGDGKLCFRTETKSTSLKWLSKTKGYAVPAKEHLRPGMGKDIFLHEEESLLVHITFKVYSPRTPSQAVDRALRRFHVKSTAKARKDLADLAKTPGASQNIRIVSKDGKEFTVPREVLAARSQIFKAMLETDMVEGNTGVIHIQDMGSKSLKVLLNYLHTGELHPDWKESRVLVELANSAAKYQLPDLLHFLDGVLGKMCDLDNVGALSGLAHGLSMGTAEKDLLSFIRRNGTASMESVIRMLKGVTRFEEA